MENKYDSDPRLFRKSIEVYQNFVEQHDQETTIMDIVEAKHFPDTNYHSIILIRNSANEDLFPYDARPFITWFEKSPTHPLTREDLSYLNLRIQFKKKCLETLEAKLFREVTPQYSSSLIPKFYELMFQKYNLNQPLNVAEEKKLLECQAYIDIASFENSHRVFTNMDMKQASERLKFLENGSWLMRRSSIQGQIMKNAEIFIIAIKKPGKVVQTRCLYVNGVGWFQGDEYMPVDSLSNLLRVKSAPKYIHICELLEILCDKKQIHIMKQVKTDK